MNSDDLLRVRRKGDKLIISCDLPGEEILELVIAETLKLQPWRYPDEADEERSICPIQGCGLRKHKANLTCFAHRRAIEPASNPFARSVSVSVSVNPQTQE